MVKLYQDDEENLLNELRAFNDKILLIPNKRHIRRTERKIINKIKNKKYWINSSAKDATPPDFFNEKDKLMLEVMRVNDSEFDDNGKIINPEAKADRKLANELSKDFQEKINNGEIMLIAISDTGLSTNENHGYKRYVDSLNRTLIKHIKHINNYRKNHKGYKLIFYIYDESRAYGESINQDNEFIYKEGDIIQIKKPHICFLDEKMLDVFINQDIDYVIWYTPYKKYNILNPAIEVPKLCLYDIKSISNNIIKEKYQNIIPLEE